MSDDWTIDSLIQFAQAMDWGRKYQDPQERIRKRKLAFNARKWARTKLSLREADQ